MSSRRELIRRYRLKKGGRDPTSRTRNSQVPKRGYWDHRVKRGGGGKKGREEREIFLDEADAWVAMDFAS